MLKCVCVYIYTYALYMGQHNDPTNVLLVLAGPFTQRRCYDPRSCESGILCSSDPMISPNGQDVEVVEQLYETMNMIWCDRLPSLHVHQYTLSGKDKTVFPIALLAWISSFGALGWYSFWMALENSRYFRYIAIIPLPVWTHDHIYE
jgi:hypothetical protein